MGLQQLSLEKMINHFLDVELKKSKKMQRSRWDTRPLSNEQLQYAAEDVKYLSDLCARQSEQLRENSLEEKAREAFAKIASSNWQEKKMDRRGYAKVAGYYSLTQLQKELLKKLYAWRFERAKDENRAIFMFMPDNILLDIVLSGETFLDVLPHEKAKVYGAELEKIISEHSY